MGKKTAYNGEGSLDRRTFLKGAALLGTAAAAGGALAGCNSPATDSTAVAASPAAQDTDRSPGTGTPVEGYICAEDWLGEAPVIDSGDIVETLEYEVVILGGGHAGTQAALAAAQEGAKVAVIEAQPADTQMWFGDDIAAYNSQVMIGIGYGPYNTAEIANEYWRRSAGRASLDIIKLYVENSGEMFDNLVSLTPETSNAFEDGHYCIQHAYEKKDGSYYPLERGGVKAWATSYQTMEDKNPEPVNGREGVSRLTELETYCMVASQDLGAEWYYGYTAVVLVQNNAGDVTGAIVKNDQGNYVQFNASKGVLLATGDFSSNPDMVYNLFDDGNEWGIRAGFGRDDMIAFARDGIGHKIGCWAGGAIEPHPRPAMSTSKSPGSPWGSAPFLYLNTEGKRFFNESNAPYIAPSTLRQPLGFTTIITDANYMETVKVTGIDHGAPNWGYEPQVEMMQQDMAKVPLESTEGGEVTSTEIVSVAEPKTSVVFASETLEGLLKLLGYEGDSLQTALASVKRYNDLCVAGVDTDYGKDAETLIPIDTPPFYGCVEEHNGSTKATLVTLAGLITDNNLNVMKLDRRETSPIKGLYAAGNCLGQRYGIGYATPSAGNSIGMAMTHGRVVGKIMANL